MRHITKFVFLILLTFTGCASLFNVDSEIVNTPIHSDSKIFFLKTEANVNFKKVPLFRPYEGINYQDKKSEVSHGDPVTIIINKVILPERLFDSGFKKQFSYDKTYDIAVILDVAAREGKDKESVAVFYQRGVKPNTALAFENLVTYSQDSWDNRLPPYFRIRIFNVSNERNKRAAELLQQVSSFASTLASIAGAPYAAPAIKVAIRAAELVIKGDNEMLVDFQFQLFSSAQTSQSGGMPIGMFRKGGMVLVGIPRGEKRQYWADKNFTYDFSSEQIFTTNPEEAIDVPFFLATVVTTDTVVPNIVKKRSAEIFKILRDDEALRTNFESVTSSLERLKSTLKAMNSKEKFALNPGIATLKRFISEAQGTSVGNGADQISESVKNWLLATVRTATGVRLTTFAEYTTWMTKCAHKVDFDANQRRFLIENAPAGVKGECS